MISNSSVIPTLHGAQITLDRIKAETHTSNRRTKIVCTMGPACWSKENIATLMDAGMNVARFNFSHGDHEGHGAVLDRLRQVASEKSRNIAGESFLRRPTTGRVGCLPYHRMVFYRKIHLISLLSPLQTVFYPHAVLLDTKGPEIRTGFFANNAKKITLTKGETIILTSDYSYLGDNKKLACSYPALVTSVKPGQQILAADGSLVLTVLTTDEPQREVMCRIENSCEIGERKNMNLPGVKVDLPTFTEKDVDDIVNFGIKKKVEFIAASFIRKAEDVRNLRKLLAENGGQHIKIISKIENQEGLENYQEILRETDAVMVARGDLVSGASTCRRMNCVVVVLLLM